MQRLWIESIGHAPIVIDLAEDVEQEWVDVEVQRLVVKEQLGEQAQVLAVHLCTRVPNLI